MPARDSAPDSQSVVSHTSDSGTVEGEGGRYFNELYYMQYSHMQASYCPAWSLQHVYTCTIQHVIALLQVAHAQYQILNYFTLGGLLSGNFEI